MLQIVDITTLQSFSKCGFIYLLFLPICTFRKNPCNHWYDLLTTYFFDILLFKNRLNLYVKFSRKVSLCSVYFLKLFFPFIIRKYCIGFQTVGMTMIEGYSSFLHSFIINISHYKKILHSSCMR